MEKNIDEQKDKQKKNLQNYTCWKCNPHTWSDIPLLEDSVECPKCGMTHGMITTDGKMIPRRRGVGHF